MWDKLGVRSQTPLGVGLAALIQSVAAHPDWNKTVAV
jgi:hypothetical protein